MGPGIAFHLWPVNLQGQQRRPNYINYYYCRCCSRTDPPRFVCSLHTHYTYESMGWGADGRRVAEFASHSHRTPLAQSAAARNPTAEAQGVGGCVWETSSLPGAFRLTLSCSNLYTHTLDQATSTPSSWGGEWRMFCVRSVALGAAGSWNKRLRNWIGKEHINAKWTSKVAFFRDGGKWSVL